jgi:hypothetical protein
METTRHCDLSFVVIKDFRCYVNGEPDQGFDIPQGATLRTIADRLIDYCKQQGIGIGGDPDDDKAYNCVREAYSSTRELKQQKVIQNNNSSSNGNGKAVRRQTVQQQAAKDGPEKKSYKVMKYTGTGVLCESVLLGGLPFFVSYRDGLLLQLELKESMEESNRVLIPSIENEPRPYSFNNIDEIRQYIDRAKKETLDSLWEKVRATVQSFNATDSRYIEILTADIIFSYFADRIGMTHYLFPYGRPGTGKGAMLETCHQLAYRAVLVSNATAANVYRLLGAIEIGQCSLLIDEANNLENDLFIMEVLKTGYKANGKVPRIMDGSSSNAEQIFFNTFGWKMIAAERLPAEYKAEGFMSRCIPMVTYPAQPKYIIDKVVNPAGDSLLEKLNAQLQKLRKLLFAYRLIHYWEPILDLKLNIDGRDEELCSPLVRLFRNSKVLPTIMSALYEFVKEKRQTNADSLEYKIFTITKQIIDAAKPDNTPTKSPKLEFMTIWNVLKDVLEGQTFSDKPQSMETPAYGKISFKMVTQTLVKFGAKRDKGEKGNRVLKFDADRLDKFSSIYLIPDKLEIRTIDTSGTSGTLWEDQ